MEFLTTEQLNKLNTRRLLGLKKSVDEKIRHALRQNYDGYYDTTPVEDMSLFDLVVYYDLQKLYSYKNEIKNILSTREHIERKNT